MKDIIFEDEKTRSPRNTRNTRKGEDTICRTPGVPSLCIKPNCILICLPSFVYFGCFVGNSTEFVSNGRIESWHPAVNLRRDVKSGWLTLGMFAADLDNVNPAKLPDVPAVTEFRSKMDGLTKPKARIVVVPGPVMEVSRTQTIGCARSPTTGRIPGLAGRRVGAM